MGGDLGTEGKAVDGRCATCGARTTGPWCGLCFQSPTGPEQDSGEPITRIVTPRPSTRWRATTTSFGLVVKVSVTLVLLAAGRVMVSATAAFPGLVYMGAAGYLGLAIPLLRALWRKAPVAPGARGSARSGPQAR